MLRGDEQWRDSRRDEVGIRVEGNRAKGVDRKKKWTEVDRVDTRPKG